MIILDGDGMLSFTTKFNKEKSITNNQLPAMSIRLGDIILGFDRSFFWISLPEAEIQVIKVELCCDIWLNFALVTAQSCAAYTEIIIGTLSYYRDSVFVLLHNASLQASHCCLYKFSPKHSPTEIKPQPH